MKNLSDYQKELHGKTCRWCDNKVLLEHQPIEHYEHSGGLMVDGFKEKQWLYVTCPKCEYQWSFWKLGIFDK
jgi:hypothetical protein